MIALIQHCCTIKMVLCQCGREIKQWKLAVKAISHSLYKVPQTLGPHKTNHSLGRFNKWCVLIVGLYGVQMRQVESWTENFSLVLLLSAGMSGLNTFQ